MVPSCPPPVSSSFVVVFLLSIVVVLLSNNCSNFTVEAFCQHHASSSSSSSSLMSRTLPQPVMQQQQQQSYYLASSSSSSSSVLTMLLRPDWMRRAGRIEELRKERIQTIIYKSLRQRQKELGLVVVVATEEGINTTTADPNKNNAKKKKKKKNLPQRYRVVSTMRNDGDINSDGHDPLKVYLFIPENKWDLNDESNVIYRLDHGEVITSTKTETIRGVDNKQQQQLTTTTVLWIEHDRGGWSPSIVDGITRLVLIE